MIGETEKNEKLDRFNAMLDEVNKVAESDDDITTQLLIKYLRSGGENLSLDDGAYFSTSFRKYDIVENDRVYVRLNTEKDTKITCSKDMIVWNLLNGRPYPFIKVLDQRLMPSDLFFEKLKSFFNKEEDLCK